MSLYANNGAAPGTGVPGGARFSPLSKQATGHIAPTLAAAHKPASLNPNSIYAQRTNPGVAPGGRLPVAPAPTPATPYPIVDSNFMTSLLGLIQPWRSQYSQMNAQMSGLNAKNSQGLTGYQQHYNGLQGQERSDGYGVAGQAADRGIETSGMYNQNLNALGSQYAQQYADLDNREGTDLHDKQSAAYALHQQMNQSKTDILQQLQGLFMNAYGNNLPGVPDINSLLPTSSG